MTEIDPAVEQAVKIVRLEQRVAELEAERDRLRAALDLLAEEWEWRVDYHRLSADGLDYLDARSRSAARGQQWGIVTCLHELRVALAPAPVEEVEDATR